MNSKIAIYNLGEISSFFVIETNDLELKFKLCTSFIVKEVIALDPLTRRQWLFTYKGIIQYADSHGTELTKEQILGADIYRDLIKQVEELIKEEDFEGQNYNAYKSRDPDYETIYKKRLKQIREDFPIPDQFKERFSWKPAHNKTKMVY